MKSGAGKSASFNVTQTKCSLLAEEVSMPFPQFCFGQMQMSRDEAFFQWSIAQYMNAAVQKGAVTDRHTMSEMFGSLLRAAAENNETEDCAEQHSALFDQLEATCSEP